MSKDGFEEVNVLRKDKPDVVFMGKLIADTDSKAEAEVSARKSGDRWTELAVYELENGDWAAVNIACSDKAGESDFGDIALIRRGGPRDDGAAGSITTLEDGDEIFDRRRPETEMRREAMEFFGWTWLAKKLAHEAGWDVRERF